jgi:RHS repeat-associated protein
MIVNKSGTLASVKRHDYLPFGEEVYAGLGGRTTTQGYTGDSTRQHFTGYEADGETGLNFAEARYQSNLQGRFTSVDPLGASASVGDPQSFNRYSYVNNNPTNLTDPTGMMTPNSATGWIQTDDESYARTEQASSDAKFKQDVNKDAAASAVKEAGRVVGSLIGRAIGGFLAGGSSSETSASQNPTLVVSGASGEELSPDNPLRFPGKKQTLGPSSLPDRWGYQVEESATVPDDVSTWLLTRTYEITNSIIYRDGTRYDGPRSSGSELVSDTSQPAGGHKLYALDAPGISKGLTQRGISESARTLQFRANFTTHLDNGTQHLMSKWSVIVNVNMITGKVTGQFRVGHIRL